MDNTIVAQGVELMLFGMGTVVVFLGLLVLITAAMSAIVTRYFPEPQVPVTASSAGRDRSPAGQADGEVVAAISAAITQHRNKKNQA